jgi:hypothetical protein
MNRLIDETLRVSHWKSMGRSLTWETIRFAERRSLETLAEYT